MIESHPKILKAFVDTQVDHAGIEVCAYFQTLLDDLAPNVATNPDLVPFFHAFKEFQSLSAHVLIQFCYELNQVHRRLAIFTVRFEDTFYEDVVGTPLDAESPVFQVTVETHACQQLITQHASVDVLHTLYDAVKDITPSMCTLDIFAPVMVYLRHLLPIASANIQYDFPEDPWREFKLTTQHRQHTVSLNIPLVQTVVAAIEARVKYNRETFSTPTA